MFLNKFCFWLTRGESHQTEKKKIQGITFPFFLWQGRQKTKTKIVSLTLPASNEKKKIVTWNGRCSGRKPTAPKKN